MGLGHRHSQVGCRCPRWYLSHWAKQSPYTLSLKYSKQSQKIEITYPHVMNTKLQSLSEEGKAQV